MLMYTRKIVSIIHVLYTDVFYEVGSCYQSASTILHYKAYTSHIYLRYIWLYLKRWFMTQWVMKFASPPKEEASPEIFTSTTMIVPNENLACCSIRSRKTLGSTLQNITTTSINVLSALGAALAWVSKQLPVLLQVLTLEWYIGGTDVSDIGRGKLQNTKKEVSVKNEPLTDRNYSGV